LVLYVPLRVDPGASGVRVLSATVEGGGGAAAMTAVEVEIGFNSAPFDLLPGSAGAFMALAGEDGAGVTQAGSTPFELLLRTGLSSFDPGGDEPLRVPDGGSKTIVADLPPGMVVDPLAIPRCREVQLENRDCPAASQVGVMALHLSLAKGTPTVSEVPVFNMVPPPNIPAELGIEATEGVVTHLIGRLRDGDFGFSAEAREISAKLGYLGNELVLWGDPSLAGHDAQRGECLMEGGSCTTKRLDAPFLRLPTSCGGPAEAVFRAASWNGSSEPVRGVVPTTDVNGEPVGVDGCGRLEFGATMRAQPTTGAADSPTGLSLQLQMPQDLAASGLAASALKGLNLTLPEGMTANVAAAAALGACNAGEAARMACPDSAKLGSVELRSPLIDHPLSGGLYLSEPYENRFGSMLAIYLSVVDAASGVGFTLAAEVKADPSSGRLTATFEDGPQLPIEELKVHLFGGPQAALATPLACGSHQVTAALMPWSDPGSATHLVDGFSTSASKCNRDEAQAPNQPRFLAGTTSPEAGRSSPLVMRIDREDGSQRLRSIDAVFPAGLAASLAGVEKCAEAALSRCPPDSLVGKVTVRAGVGAMPLPLRGVVYLAGPYRRAPVSLVLVAPAVAGPFDLGEIAVRVALYVDPRSGSIRAVTDPLPEILQGLPLNLRSVVLTLDRPGFTLNPTSCDPVAVDATAVSVSGQGASLSSRFQVGGCARLGFRPRLGIRMLGPVHRGGHPSLRAVLRPRPGDANLRQMFVALPAGELLDSRHVRGVCPRKRYAEGTCPPDSVYGSARVWSPLLDRPLRGPVFLRSSSHRLPDLVVALTGELRIDLVAGLEAHEGRLGVGFGSLPDLPLTKLRLRLDGGPRGLFVNSGSLCRPGPRARVTMAGQNGRIRFWSQRIGTSCEAPDS
jgi:hypothetical protein